ncbi:hypothetical protein VPH35_016832 [Triticum aestivum]
MSFSSGASSSSRGGGLSRRGEQQAVRSPVPYQEQPMDYEPARNCSLCRKKAPRWISWSRANPGRSYYACVDAQHGFIDWHDGPTTPFLRGLLGDLRDKVWRLEDYLAAQSREGQDAGLTEEMKKNELVAETRARFDKKKEMEMYKFLFYGMMFFVVGLVVGLLLS